MSKQAKQGNQRNLQETQRLGGQLDDYTNRLNQGLYGAQQRSNDLYGQIRGGYSNLYDRALGQVGRGGKPFSSGAMPYYQEFARTGGINDENRSRLRGGGVFDEFSRTGGLSEADRGNIRAQSTAAIPGFFDSLAAELGRSNEATGGQNPGYNSQMSMLARDRSRGAADAALNAEVGIMDRVNEGRRWGASSMSGAEGELIGATQRGRLAGIQGMGDLDKFGADLDFRNRGMDLDSMRLALSANSGLGDLYSARPGETGMYEDLLGRAIFGGADARRGLIQDWMQYNPNQSWMQRNMGWLSGIPGMINPMAGLFGRNQRQPMIDPQQQWDMFRTMPFPG